MDGERVVERQEARVRVPEDLDHHGQLHGARGVEPQIRANEERVGAFERAVVEPDGTAGARAMRASSAVRNALVSWAAAAAVPLRSSASTRNHFMALNIRLITFHS